MLERAHCVIVPVVPSVIDIRATETFIEVLLAMPKVRAGEARVGIVANKLRPSMPPPAAAALSGLDADQPARLLDSDMYLRAAEGGVGIFEMDPGQSAVERRHSRRSSIGSPACKRLSPCARDRLPRNPDPTHQFLRPVVSR